MRIHLWRLIRDVNVWRWYYIVYSKQSRRLGYDVNVMYV